MGVRPAHLPIPNEISRCRLRIINKIYPIHNHYNIFFIKNQKIFQKFHTISPTFTQNRPENLKKRTNTHNKLLQSQILRLKAPSREENLPQSPKIFYKMRYMLKILRYSGRK